MVAPSLRIPLSLNMDDFQKNIESAKSLTSTATKFITKQFIDMNASVLATQGAAGGAVLGFRTLLGVLGPLTLAVTGIVGVFKLMGYATELAKEKIEEFNETAEKAAKANVSTDFFQRFTKSGEQLRLTVEDVTAALNKFNAVSKDSLGGSELQQRVDQLVKAGNFSGNTGVAALAGGGDTEEKLRNVVKLIDQAFESGQRIAGLDIAEKAFGSKVANNLRQDATYLDQMLTTADKLSASKIVSDEQLAQAISLKNRLEEAEKVLSERFKPIQDDLAKLGVQYHQSWIEIVELMASAVGKANSLYDAIKQIPGVLADLGSASFWTKLSDASEALGLNSRPSGLIKAGEEGFAQPAGFAALGSALGNPNAVRQAMQQATDVQSKVRGDSSKAPAKEIADTADAYDRAIEGLTKHTARQEADAQSVGKGAAAMEELRAEAQLLTAAQQAGLPIDQKRADQIQDLAQDAADAADKLAKARVASETTFGQKTAFLTAEDVQIASQLRGIYGNDIPAALASTEAAALRGVGALRQLSDLGQDVNRGVFVEFGQSIRNGASAFDALRSAGVSALGKIADKLSSMAADKLWSSAFGGTSGNIFSSLFGGSGVNANGSIAGAVGATSVGGAPLVGAFAGGTDSAPGGWSLIGENGPEIMNVPKGAQIIPNDIARGMGGGISAPVNISIDARGADPAVEARLNAQIAGLKATLPGTIVSTVKQARTARVL